MLRESPGTGCVVPGVRVGRVCVLVPVCGYTRVVFSPVMIMDHMYPSNLLIRLLFPSIVSASSLRRCRQPASSPSQRIRDYNPGPERPFVLGLPTGQCC